MSNTQPSLSRAQYLANNLGRVILTSASECSICQEPYSDEAPKQPVILPECGHIFCRSCITAWFASGGRNANTCPVDRRVLFQNTADPPTSLQTRPQELPFTSHQAFPSGLGGGLPSAPRPAHTPTRFQAPPPAPFQSDVADDVREWQMESMFGDCPTLRIDETLTHAGCRIVVTGLQFSTAEMLFELDRFSGVRDVGNIDVELVRSCIQGNIPFGARLSQECWDVLYGHARWMLAWHRMNGCARFSHTEMDGGDLDDMVDELYAASIRARW
ncbi:hypothetical protein C7974DRAFT_103291 [Boeremia exigua]|uniref:uncharacterized protein n=1 Tax=Boeremia exigua TaxID=749465 RepID=UPI001E8D4B2A|nr:uncharacterized protein C7974DRAFT_103291 [Boeremia exigua]KAH6642498.1 hypothetical protein C7974DRAFT_103291 [Boeremia exigua]